MKPQPISPKAQVGSIRNAQISEIIFWLSFHALSHGVIYWVQSVKFENFEMGSPHQMIVVCYCHTQALFEFWLFQKVVKPPVLKVV